MATTAVKTAWSGGNLYFYDKSGNVIFYIDGTNRAMVFASGAGLTAPTAIDATDIAAGAVTYGKITLTAGNVLVGTKTTDIASLLDISAKGAIPVGQGAGETPGAKTLSGDVTMDETGAVTIAAKAVEASMVALTAGYVFGGTKTTNAASAIDMSAAGAILVGQGAGETPAAKTLSGNVTMASTGAVTIAAGAVTNAMLASGAGVGAIITAGLGNSASYVKTTDGVQTLLAAHASKDRGVLVVAVVDETFADAGGTQPTLKIGEAGTDDKCWGTATFANAAAGTIFCKGFLNTSTKAIIATCAKAVTTGTGGASISVLALPNS